MKSVQSLTLKAPLSGPVIALEKVPDPVFSQRMVGDGVSIDPTSNELLAPCEGIVSQVHPSLHAVTLMTPVGLEVMIHIGIDTVSLKGEGFTPAVQEGQSVACGDVLIQFDLASLGRNARSLLTQVLVTNGDGLSIDCGTAFVSAGEDILLTVRGQAEAVASGAVDEQAALTSEPVRLANPLGLHARPAAVLARKAKAFSSEVELVCGSRRANAKSTTAIMKMEVGPQATVLLRASGPDAGEAIESLTAELLSGLGEAVTSALAETEEAGAEAAPASGNPNELAGFGASPGIAMGQVHRLLAFDPVVDEFAGDVRLERQKLEDALRTARQQLRALASQPGSPEAGIFEAHEELLDDPELIASAIGGIERGQSAAFAWREACDSEAGSLEGLESALLAQRADDLRDVGTRVLKCILGIGTGGPELPEGCILLAADLTPSQTAGLDPARVRGLATVRGGTTSHVAILARAMGLPAIAGIEARALDLPDGTPVILNGDTGLMEVDPSQERRASVAEEIEERTRRSADNKAHCHEPAATADGHAVTVVANAASLDDIEQGMAHGGEGVGLLRTEILFQGRAQAPAASEQEQVYREMAQRVGDKGILTIRTLDAGGDKPLPYLPIPKEENPFLGERGIRVSLGRPALFREQVRAILKASGTGAMEIMFPMVTTLGDFTRAKAIVEEERAALSLPPVKLGLMIEVPSAALMAEVFAGVADFFSIGTNDLAQYALAIDRGHPKLAAQADALSPAVLKLISLSVEAINKAGKPISVCGGMASDPQAVALLLGLGIRKLSVSPMQIPDIKALVRTLSLGDCQELARKALSLQDATEVRALVSNC